MSEHSITFEEQTQINDILELFSSYDVFNGDNIIKEPYNTGFPAEGGLRSNQYSFYKINKVSYDEEYPRREAFENVLLTMDNEAFNFVYILNGNPCGIDLYIGIVENSNENNTVLGTRMSAVRYGENIAEAFKGNFNGSELEELKADKIKSEIIEYSSLYKHAGLITGVPSIDETNGENYDFQGIDRLINSLMGEEWRIVIVCEPVSKSEIAKIRDNVYELYNRLSVWAKQNIQQSISEGTNEGLSKNKSDSRGKNQGVNDSVTTNKGKNRTDGDDSYSSGTGKTKGTSKGTSENHTEGITLSTGKNKSTSRAVTVEWANKCVQEMMKYIDDELLERMKNGLSKRMFKTSLQYMAKEPVVANRLKVGLMSLFQGENPSYSPLRDTQLDLNNIQNYRVLKSYQNTYVYSDTLPADKLTLLGRPFFDKCIGVNTFLTPREISLLAGIPQKEVPGLILKESVGFGLNEKPIDNEDKINLGYLVQKGRILNKMPFYLDKDALVKHVFIAGVTGSGKTTTCHRLLAAAKVPFMVIEPAKTEYRTLINNEKFSDDLVVFTVGNEKLAPFRINPFEVVKGELITGHIDMLKATFTSAFPMEASMPQLLEEAMYSCYEAMGWDIETNTNDYYDDPYAPDADAFPQLSDLLKAMEKVVDNKNFDERLRKDYIGSLVSRLSNLTVGSKGLMLNCKKSVDFNYLAHHNVILELEDIKSPEEKALIMGFVLSRMSAVIKNEHKKDSNYRHITLVEEAHRLLSKVDYGDSGSKKVAVETFTDLLAEVRKYGEGLIIVDQIPNKLAPEVLKNTNTKIIHRILAKDDKETVGDTMLMNDKQKDYLSSLEKGHTIIFAENTDNPVNVYVEKVSDTNEDEPPESIITDRFSENKNKLGGCYKEISISSLMKIYNNMSDLIIGKTGDLKNKWDIVIEKREEIQNRIDRIVSKQHVSQDDVIDSMVRRRDILRGYRYSNLYSNYKSYPKRISSLKQLFEEIPNITADEYIKMFFETLKPGLQSNNINDI